MAEAGFAADVSSASTPTSPRSFPRAAPRTVGRHRGRRPPAHPGELALARREARRAVPPHYAGYYAVPRAMAEKVDELLRPSGHGAAFLEPPLKTLAACSGLARYGRNNIAYVDGLGSWLQLGACVERRAAAGRRGVGRARGAAALRALQRLPARLPDRRHRRRPLRAPHRALPDLAQRGRRRPSRTGSTPRRTTAPSAACVASRSAPRTCAVALVQAAPESFDEAETAAILAAEESAPGGAAVLEAAPATTWPGLTQVDAREARSLRSRLLAQGHRAQPPRAAGRVAGRSGMTTKRVV